MKEAAEEQKPLQVSFREIEKSVKNFKRKKAPDGGMNTSRKGEKR